MPLPGPTADEQIAFLQKAQRLLSEGLFTATYKYALLQALADLAVLRGDDTGDPLDLTTREIAEQMIHLYWRQAAPFPTGGGALVLRQSTHQQAEIVSRLSDVKAFREVTLAGLQAQPVAWRGLVGRVERVLKKQPLWKLQTVGAQPLEFLYPNEQGASVITLLPGIAFCLRAFHGLITDLLRGAWLRHIRRVNGQVLGHAVDLDGFLFGTERSGLGAYQPLLAELQSGRCFYCQRSLAKGSEVDHFIPWARYPADLGPNFVLVHPNCNHNKGAHLADVDHLARWVERNDLHATDIARATGQTRLDEEWLASRHVARWAYGQADRAHGQVWVRGRVLVPLTSDWSSLLPL
jgi:5-methylcytosine-specific restriction endonuclease McrA